MGIPNDKPILFLLRNVRKYACFETHPPFAQVKLSNAVCTFLQTRLRGCFTDLPPGPDTVQMQKSLSRADICGGGIMSEKVSYEPTLIVGTRTANAHRLTQGRPGESFCCDEFYATADCWQANFSVLLFAHLSTKLPGQSARRLRDLRC